MSEHGVPPSNEMYVGLDERIKYWDDIIAAYPEKTPEGLQPIRDMAVAELDKHAAINFGVQLGEWCVVSGMAVYCDPDDESHENRFSEDAPVTGQQPKYEAVAAMEGVFGGLTLQQFNDDPNPRLWYIFQHGMAVYHPNPFMGGPVPCFRYVDPVTATIVPAAAFEMPYPHRQSKYLGKENTIPSDLAIQSKELAHVLKTTRFRRLPRLEQLKVVDTIINETEELTDVLEAQVKVCAKFGFISHEGFKREVDYRAIGLEDVFLSGACLALGMLGRERLLKTPIRKKSDIIDVQRGITLSLELDEESDLGEGLPLMRGSILHIPLFGQSLAMTVR